MAYVVGRRLLPFAAPLLGLGRRPPLPPPLPDAPSRLRAEAAKADADAPLAAAAGASVLAAGEEAMVVPAAGEEEAIVVPAAGEEAIVARVAVADDGTIRAVDAELAEPGLELEGDRRPSDDSDELDDVDEDRYS